jgi:hypothetical protein
MKKFLTYSLAILFAGTMASCSKSDPPLPDNTINFTADKQGIDAATSEVEVKLSLSRNADVAIPLTVTLTSTGVVYGTQYTTDPAAVNNAITLTIPVGSTTASFKVKRVAGTLLNGSEKIAFTLTSAGSPIVLGSTSKAELSFAAIISEGSSLTLNGTTAANEAGASAGNSVYVDFSGNAQVAVARDSWVLGFSSGSDFRVRLNNFNGTSAIVLADKSDLTTVTEAQITLSDFDIPLGTAGAFGNIDNVYGDVTKDIISTVSATDASNKVYVINPVGGSRTAVLAMDNLYKIRIIRKGEGYTLQYAKVKETTFKTIDIPKNGTYNFDFVNFDAGTAKVLPVEPSKANWDFVWSWSLYYGGTGTAAYPYGFSDIVFTNNLGGVTVAEVPTSSVSYANYGEGNITSTTFLNKHDVIGSAWRSTSPATGVKTDRFYAIKDGSGNVYKLRFVSMGAGDGGVRGKPVIEYKLVKKN